MTLEQQIENIYQSTIGLEDNISIQTYRILKNIKLQITADKCNRNIETLLDSHVARILDRNVNNLERYLSHESESTVEIARIQTDLLISLLPTKLTEEELTIEMQNIKTANPECTIQDMYVYLDHLYYDFNMIENVYLTLS